MVTSNVSEGVTDLDWIRIHGTKITHKNIRNYVVCRDKRSHWKAGGLSGRLKNPSWTSKKKSSQFFDEIY